jgi:hypothetical protein
MGYFSKCCAKTFLPVVVPDRGIPRLNRIVALLPDGRKIEGAYDGYGRVETEAGFVEVRDDWDKAKFILAEWYEGEGYEDVGKSGDELAQGYFMSKQFLHYCLFKGPFKDRAAYTRAFKKLAGW